MSLVPDEIVQGLADGNRTDEGDLIEIARELVVWRELGVKVLPIIKPDAPLRHYKNDAVRDAIRQMIPEDRLVERGVSALVDILLKEVVKAVEEDSGPPIISIIPQCKRCGGTRAIPRMVDETGHLPCLSEFHDAPICKVCGGGRESPGYIVDLDKMLPCISPFHTESE